MKTIIFFLFTITSFAQIARIIPFSSNPAGGGGPAAYVTDSLKHYWVLDSLADGSVENWYDAIGNYRLTIYTSDSTFRPIKSSTKLDFDGGDWLRGTVTGGGALTNFTSSPMSIEVVVTLEAADTTTTDALVFSVSNGNALTLGIKNSRISAVAFDGATYDIANSWSTPFVGTHHWVTTWDGSNTPILYLDGVAQTDMGDLEAPSADGRGLLGGDEAAVKVPDGTSIPLMRVYKLQLSAGQVDTNYDSDSVQDLIP